MITSRAFVLLSLTMGGAVVGASSCSLDTNGSIDPETVSEFGSSSSSASSGSSSATGSSGSATGGAGGNGGTTSASGGMGGTGGIGGMGGIAGTGGTGGTPCPGTQMLCGGMCVDTSTNNAHCGKCDNACAKVMPCQGGICLVCAPGTMQACYSGPPNTENVGACKGGRQTCAADGMSWGTCMGEVLPATETCGNAVDEDCNGIVAGGSTCLVNTDLVVRYFLDEAASGQGVQAVDSAPNPLNLPIVFNSNQPNYSSVMTGRGLEWTTADSNGVAKVSANGTKIQNLLNGKKKATLELVTRMDASAGFNRLFGLTSGMSTVFTLVAVTGPGYALWLNGGEVGRWNVNFGNTGRSVLHVVFDTTDANMANRARFYVNGALQTSVTGNVPSMDATLTINGNDWFCIGNRDTEQRSIDGVVYYAAMYANALSAADIATNYAILNAGDDK